MKRYIPVIILCFVTFFSSGQINFQYTPGQTRVLPNSVIKPTTSIYPDDYDTDQMIDCATDDRDSTEFYAQPWIGNNQYLYGLLSEYGYPLGGSPQARVEANSVVKYKIPVKFWIYRDNNGNGGITPRRMQILIDELNTVHRVNNTGIRFYQLDNVDYINDSDRLNVNTLAGVVSWINQRHVNRALNVHVVENVKGAGGFFTSVPQRAVFIERLNDPSSIVHEVGHFLGLDHTHQYYKMRGLPIEKCFVEPVDHSRRFPDITLCNSRPFQNKLRCEATGDGLCDTPADPIIERGDVTGCVWTNTDHAPDIYGDSYSFPPNGSESPNQHNIMSYGALECRDFISFSQIGVMLHSIEKGANKPRKDEWTTPSVIFDTHEPDNEATTARLMNFNEQTQHTFHTEYSGNLYNDVDWIRFQVPSAGQQYTIKTSLFPGYVSADTEIRLYSISPTNTTSLLASDDNSGGGIFSKIVSTLPVGNYVVEVINKNPSAFTGYSIGVYPCYDATTLFISGPSLVCSSNAVFSLNNTPPNSSVFWTSTGVNINSGQGTSSVNVTSNSNGQGTLTATISADCGGVILSNQYSFSFAVGLGNAVTSINIIYSDCYEQKFQTNSLPGSSVTWEYFKLPNGSPVTLANQSYSIKLAIGVAGNYRIGARSVCNSSNTVFTDFYVPCSNNKSSIAVSPNPASEEMEITILMQDTVDTQSSSLKRKAEIGEYEITLFDKTSRPVLHMRSKESRFTIPIGNLPEDVYYLNVRNKEAILQRQVIVKRK